MPCTALVVWPFETVRKRERRLDSSREGGAETVIVISPIITRINAARVKWLTYCPDATLYAAVYLAAPIPKEYPPIIVVSRLRIVPDSSSVVSVIDWPAIAFDTPVSPDPVGLCPGNTLDAAIWALHGCIGAGKTSARSCTGSGRHDVARTCTAQHKSEGAAVLNRRRMGGGAGLAAGASSGQR